MASSVIDIELRVKIDKLRAELEKIPGINEKESKKMAMAWSRDYAKVEKSAQRAARDASRQADRTREAWKSAGERTASLMGGVFGDISDSVLDLGGRMSELASDIGGTKGAIVGLTGVVAGVAAAAGFASHAFLEWMDGIEDTRKALKDVRGIPPMSTESLLALSTYVETAEKAEAASAALKLQFQAGLAPAATELQLAMTGLSASMVDVTESETAGTMWKIHKALQNTNAVQIAVNAAWDYMIDVGEEVTETYEKAADTFEAYGPALEMAGKSEAKLSAERRAAARASEAAKKAEDKRWADGAKQIAEAIRRENELAEAAARREELGEEAWASHMESLDKATQGYEGLRTAGEEYDAFVQDQIKESYLEAMDAMATATADLVEGEIQYHIDSLIEEEQQIRKVHQKEMDRLKAARDAVAEQIKSGRISAKEGKEEIKRINDEMKAKRDARRQERKDHKDALREAFAAQQAAAVARAVVDAAANAVALTAAFAYAGPAAPGLALGVAGAQLALQLAAIRKVKPPKFAMGGMVRDRMEGDHAPVMAEANEGILTPRGVSNVGGPDGVRALNAGTAGGRAGGGTRVYLDSRIMGEIVARAVESDQRVTAALDQQSGAIPGVRR